MHTNLGKKKIVTHPHLDHADTKHKINLRQPNDRKIMSTMLNVNPIN